MGTVMRMQESIISTEQGQNLLRLSGALSEWLVSSKFWSDFNAEYGTAFDQFEEDEADIAILNALVAALDETVLSLRGSDAPDVEFVYRWTFERDPVTAVATKVGLLDEIERFRCFLVEAIKQNRRVTFAL
jgi:hypothetical protein